MHQMFFEAMSKPNRRIAIVGKTIDEANEIFDELNVYDKSFFVRYQKQRKETKHGVKYFLTGSNVSCNLRGTSIQFLILSENVPKKCLEEIYNCIAPCMWSNTLGIILLYKNKTFTEMKGKFYE